MNRKLLVTGAPRNGSTFLTMCLNLLGIDTQRHEWGRQAQVSWKNLEVSDDCLVIHLLRNPFHAIPQLIQDNTKLTNYSHRQQVILDQFGIDINKYSELDNAALTFFLWNSLIEKKFADKLITLQVEKAHTHLRNTLTKLGYISSSRRLESYDKPPTIIDGWAKVDPEIMKILDGWCAKNGYPTVTEQYKSYQREASHKNSAIRPAVYAPRHRELPSPQTTMGRVTKNTVPSEKRNEVVISPRFKHVVIKASGSTYMTPREALRKKTFSIK